MGIIKRKRKNPDTGRFLYCFWVYPRVDHRSHNILGGSPRTQARTNLSHFVVFAVELPPFTWFPRTHRLPFSRLSVIVAARRDARVVMFARRCLLGVSWHPKFFADAVAERRCVQRGHCCSLQVSQPRPSNCQIFFSRSGSAHDRSCARWIIGGEVRLIT